MRKSKILITSIATLLSVAAIGTTIALYSNSASKTINIGGTVTAGEGSYTLSALTTSGEISPAVGSYNAKTKISLTKGEGYNYSQSIAVGDVTITVTIPTAIDTYISKSAKVEGYYEGNYWYNNSTFSLKKDETNSNGTNTIYKATKSVAFETKGVQEISLTLDTNGSCTDDIFVSTVAEKAISYNISVSQNADFKAPYLTGSFNSWSTEAGLLEMVPDIMSVQEGGNTDPLNQYSWVYELALEEQTTFKVITKNGLDITWYGDSTNSNKDFSLDGGSYKVYLRENGEGGKYATYKAVTNS